MISLSSVLKFNHRLNQRQFGSDVVATAAIGQGHFDSQKSRSQFHDLACLRLPRREVNVVRSCYYTSFIRANELAVTFVKIQSTAHMAGIKQKCEGKALISLGFERKQKRVGGHVVWLWFPTDKVSHETCNKITTYKALEKSKK